MDTPNKIFNDAWHTLKEYHGEDRKLPNGVCIDLSHRPWKYQPNITSDDVWKIYMEALFNVLVIGMRERYLQVHLDGVGYPVYLYVPDEIAGDR